MTDRSPHLPDFDDFEWNEGETEWDSSPPEWLNQIPRAGEGTASSPEDAQPSPATEAPLPQEPPSVPPIQEPVPAPEADRPHVAEPRRTAYRGLRERQQVRPRTRARRSAYANVDPVFIYLVLMALSLGLTPLANQNPLERYTILWTLLTLGGLYWVVTSGSGLRIGLQVNDLIWGGVWGIVLGTPLLLIGANVLSQTSVQMFVGLPVGAVFQSTVYVMSLAETLFFRGMMQQSRSWPVTAGLATAWSVLLFFPTLDLADYPMLAVIIGTLFAMLSALYSYVRQRNGLAAAWLCQVVVSVLWLVVPRLLV
jgi:hypothetical protein